jgi:hypothetical protein
LTDYNKPRPWNGKALKGIWEITIKIDGWRALWNGSEWRSRADKPLKNVPAWSPGMPTDCEIYLGSLRETARALQTIHMKPDTPIVEVKHLYSLSPLDSRLELGMVVDPTAEQIFGLLDSAIKNKYEGLVLRQGERWIKVKPNETHDVLITGAGEGEEGKHLGRLGFVTTALGDVGTGFSDDEREEMWAEHLAGTLAGQSIEVGCMHMTADGKFRHPFFIRKRPDKVAEI